jgi:PAS domain S-box-containing protein
MMKNTCHRRDLSTICTKMRLEDVIARLGDYTEDAVLITEGQPIDLPGPRIVWVNKAFTRTTGYTMEEVLGQTPRILQRDDDDRRPLDRIRKALTHWEPVREELVNYHKDGTSFWVELCIVPVGKEDDWCHYWVAVQRDISERKAMEAKLQQVATHASAQRERLAAIADAAPGALYEFSLDAEGKFTFPYVSVGFAELYGFPVERLQEDASIAFTTMDARYVDPMLASIRESAAKLSRWHERFLVHHPDGRRWLEGTSIPKYNEADKSITWFGYLQDVTEHVEREEALQEAKQEAEAANEAKARFLGNISHELRTPLSGILGMADMLAETDLTEEQQDYLNCVLESGQYLLRIFNDILDYAKIDSRKITLSPTHIQLETLSDSIRYIHESIARDKDIAFSLEVSDPHTRLADGDRIQQILHNLINNAIKHTQKGEVDIRIEMDPQDVETIRIDIYDTGSGIPEGFLPQIYEPFSQADSGLNRAHTGSGLGLSITKGIVDAMGGSISIQNREGGGTHVSVVLKLPIAEQALLPAPHKPISNLKVLSMEDSPLNRKVLEALLTKMGHKVTLAENGQLGLEKFKADSFDLVLMDIQMPVMDGLETLRAIREWESEHKRFPTPVVAMTGHAMSHHIEQYKQVGFTDTVVKPIQKAKLAELMAAIVQ